MTREKPSSVVERSSSMPLTVLTDSSITLVTRASISSGPAPGSVVVIDTTGMSVLREEVDDQAAVGEDPHDHQGGDAHGGE